MHGHFESYGPFAGNGNGNGNGNGHGNPYHRPSHSTSDSLGGHDFSMMHAAHHQMAPSQQTQPDPGRMSATSATYQSHDDLCLEGCMGVGLYNGFQQLNHRGAPPSLQSRWTRDPAVPRYDFENTINHDMPMHFRTTDAASFSQNPYHQQSWYPQTHMTACAVPCTDDDCQSAADSCCDSECTMTDKCTNVACADIADACTDQTCPGRPDVVAATSLPTSEVVDGAAALISINHHSPTGNQHHDFDNLQRQAMGNMDFDLSGASEQPFLLQPELLPGQWGNITNHLLRAHSDTADPSSSMTNQPPAFNQFGSVGQPFQASQHQFIECGAEIQDVESFLAHFNEQHRPYLTAAMPHLPRASVETQNSHHPMMDAPSQNTSPPATPLDTPDSGRSSGTPSPLTPLSNNIEMTDVKHDPASSLARGMSISSTDQSMEPAIADDDEEDESDDDGDEHRCLWRDEGRPNVCGLVFANAEDLFKHASEAHIRHAQKGAQGFRCGWDDCPRSDPNAPGFPQRSKIERHMQTHIGHKPHICPTCNKGFSAKQALTQHMFIHSNEKPLVCNICNKAFRYPSALTMHQRVHSGLKPLKCPVCGKGFSESSNLSKHKRTHEVKGRFTCSVPGCDRNFHRQDQLRRHMKTHQKESDSARSSVSSLAAAVGAEGVGG
ncbi:hypothetical protein VTJ49DRAFT_5316 [Mycothermus thermophilus]|uniref:C2H2-type domain-containing protein n=1 Tax=Humicola insolens TaxID=85995 RepID=A0ABR3V3F3_HUMIN